MILLITSYMLLASAITANKIILFTLPPDLFVALRMLFAGILLFSIGFWSSERLRWRYVKPDILALGFIALCVTFIPSLLKAFALKYLISSKAAFFGGLDPFITALYAFLLWKEKLTPLKAVGLLLGFLGTSIMLTATSPLEETMLAFSIISYPELAAIAAVAISRYGWILAQNLLKKERYAPAELNGLMMIIGGIYAAITTWYNESYTTITPSLFTPTVIILLSYTIIIGNMVGYTLLGQSLKKYSPTLISLTGFFVPLFVQFFGYLFVQEPLSWHFFAAIGITAAGIILFYVQEFPFIQQKTP